jgi:hypothetical protein
MNRLGDEMNQDKAVRAYLEMVEEELIKHVEEKEHEANNPVKDKVIPEFEDFTEK